MKNSCAASVWSRLLALVVSITFVVGNVIPTYSFAQGASTKANVEHANRLAKKAKADFAERHFEDAAAGFIEAFALSKEPSLLFNAARAHQESGRFVEARAEFRLYRAQPKVDQEGMAAADARIAECDRELAKIESAKVPPPPVVVPDDGLGGVQFSIEVTKATDDQVEGFAFKPKKLISVQSGVAVALLGIGAGLMIHSASRSAEANTLPLKTAAQKAAYHSEFSSVHLEWGVGITTCVIGAGVAYWAVWRAVSFGGSASSSKATTATSLIPTVNNDGFGLAFSSSF